VEGSKTVLLVGTLDTKGAEYAYLRERLRLHGVDTILADAGVNEPVGVGPDLHVGGDTAGMAAAGDRGALPSPASPRGRKRASPPLYRVGTLAERGRRSAVQPNGGAASAGGHA
jgi:hypothetical protein